MKITVRSSRKEEAELLIAIWCRSVDATHQFLAKKDRKNIEFQVRDFLLKAPCWVTPSDTPVAFMLLSGNHMDALFVDPDSRGCGIGRTLINHALSLTTELTTDVNEQNIQAVDFYKKMKFVQIGFSETDNDGRNYPLLHLRYQG